MRPSSFLRGHGAVATACLLVVAGAAVALAAFWPGVMTWDAIRQYGQASGAKYDDWHPPAMNWLWRRLFVLGPGPAPMLLVQAASYAAGFALLAVAAGRRGRWWRPLAVAAVAWLPMPLLLVGTVLKDSLMAGALLLAAGLIAVSRDRGWVTAVAAALLLFGAATLRFNAVPACLPLALLLVPPQWRRSLPGVAVAGLAAAAVLFAALPLANRALHARHSGVELSLVIYDLAGITRYSGVDAFPPLGVAEPVAVNARCYSPVSWDRYAWWGADPCPIQFDAVRRAFAAGRRGAFGWWVGAVAAHPVAYAEHRLAHANRNLRFLVRDDDLPPLSTASDPNRWNYRVAPGPLRDAVARAAVVSLATPLGWPICWLAVAAGCLILRPGRLAAALAWSSLLYGLSYLPLSVASEARYHFWTITAAALAAALTLGDGRRRGAVRWTAAALPVAAITLAALAARL